MSGSPRMLFVCIAVSSIGLVVSCNDFQPKHEQLSEAQCEQLVEQLANSNTYPFTDSYMDELPRHEVASIRANQAHVKDAFDKLNADFATALPILAKHTRDDRYSYVFITCIGECGKTSVGQACSRLIIANVEPYSNFAGVFRADHFVYPSFIKDVYGGDISQWWATRKGKSLAELQLEALDWVLKNQQPALYQSSKEWAQVKTGLENMTLRIRESGEPATAYKTDDCRFLGP